MTTNQKGRVAEAQVLAKLVELGAHVLMPFGNSGRYDIAVDVDGKLVRVEVKTGRYSPSGITFNTDSRGGYGNKPGKSYAGDADYFAVWCKHVSNVYLVPVSIAPKTSMLLRFTPPRSKPGKAWMADDFKLVSQGGVEPPVFRLRT